MHYCALNDKFGTVKSLMAKILAHPDRNDEILREKIKLGVTFNSEIRAKPSIENCLIFVCDGGTDAKMLQNSSVCAEVDRNVVIQPLTSRRPRHVRLLNGRKQAGHYPTLKEVSSTKQTTIHLDQLCG